MRSTTPFCVGTLCLASWVMLPATALAQQGPSLQYQPVPGESIGFAVSAGTPVERSIAVSPLGGSAGIATNLNCFVRQPALTFRVLSPPLAFNADGAAQSLDLACTPGFSGLQMANLECIESIGFGPTSTRTWPLLCPSFTPAPAFTSVPANGQTVVVNAPPDTIAVAGPVLGNAGLLSYSVSNCTVSGIGLSLLTTMPVGVASGAAVPPDLSCMVPSSVGTTVIGSLQCTTSIPGLSLAYPLQCTAFALPADLILRASFEDDEQREAEVFRIGR